MHKATIKQSFLKIEIVLILNPLSTRQTQLNDITSHMTTSIENSRTQKTLAHKCCAFLLYVLVKLKQRLSLVNTKQ